MSTLPPQQPDMVVNQGYSQRDDGADNPIKLRALVGFFGLSPAQIARATGFSRPYVARILSEQDSFHGSPKFYRKLETELGTIIGQRATQVFAVPAMAVGQL